MVGLRNEQDGSLTTQGIRTDPFEPGAIEKGLVPGWVELPKRDELAIQVMFGLLYADALPESAEEMERMKESLHPKQTLHSLSPPR